MLPCSTYVLDHTLALTPDDLFDVVAGFVSRLLSDPPRPLWAGCPMRFTLTGVEWDAGRTAINVNAQLNLPRQEDHWSLQDTGTYQIVHAPAIQWDSSSSMALVQVQVAPCGTGQVRARIMAHPTTDAEQLAIRLAAHIVKDSACTAYSNHAQLVQAQDAAFRKWLAWLDARITGLMAEKKAREEGFVFPVETRITLRPLHTTVDIFMHELWTHFQQFPPPRVPMEDGTISLKATSTPGNLVQPPSLYLFARQHPAEGGMEIPPPTVIGPVVFFQATRRGTERIDLDITCRHRRLEAYVEGLASRINEWYPEARQVREGKIRKPPPTIEAIADSIKEIKRTLQQTLTKASEGVHSPASDHVRTEPSPPARTDTRRIDIPPRPTQPNQASALEEWFDWYHACQDAGFKVTLKDVASKSGYSDSHVKKQHALYAVSLGYQKEPNTEPKGT